MRPQASIVIVAWGNRRASEACLQSLDRALGDELGRRFELVLVDNDSPDDTLELFERWSERARIVALPQNRNFAGGCNAGAAAARGDVLVFLNNDTEVPRAALEPLVEQALAPDVGIVGARLLYPNGRIQHAGVVFREVGPRAHPLHLFVHEPGDLPAARATYDLDATTGACLVTRRQVFDALGRFDERYLNGIEDIDLCIKARIAGHRIVVRGDVAIIHHEKLTRGARHDDEPNRDMFFARFGSVCGGDDEMLATTFGVRYTPRNRWFATPQLSPDGTPIVFAGEVETLAPEAAEGRALLWLAGAAGLDPALRDGPPVYTAVLPALDGELQAAIDHARMRSTCAAPLAVHVPAGTWWQTPVATGAVRIGREPVNVRDDHFLLVPSAALKRTLVTSGIHPERIDVLPPPLRPVPLGSGGGGLLALLPGHDLDRCETVLAALAPIDSPVALLPNVRAAPLEALVARRLPHASVLSPVTDEAAYGLLAGRYDVVVSAAEEDPFERRALVAAAAGTALVAAAGGPAAEVVHDVATITPALDAVALRAAVETALHPSVSRAARADSVAAACGLHALGDRLVALLDARRSQRRVHVADLERELPARVARAA